MPAAYCGTHINTPTPCASCSSAQTAVSRPCCVCSQVACIWITTSNDQQHRGGLPPRIRHQSVCATICRYTTARRWLRNEPEVDVESVVGPVSQQGTANSRSTAFSQRPCAYLTLLLPDNPSSCTCTPAARCALAECIHSSVSPTHVRRQNTLLCCCCRCLICHAGHVSSAAAPPAGAVYGGP